MAVVPLREQSGALKGAVKVTLPRNWVDRVYSCLEWCSCCVPFLNNVGQYSQLRFTARLFHSIVNKTAVFYSLQEWCIRNAELKDRSCSANTTFIAKNFLSDSKSSVASTFHSSLGADCVEVAG